jgi:hypothetical protein
LDILGKREKWLVDGLNNDKIIINEILDELVINTEYKVEQLQKKMIEYKFNQKLIDEVLGNFKNLQDDLKNEGVEFE